MTKKATTNKNSIKKKPDTIFIDFDGVISKNSILYNFKSAYQFINQYISIPYDTVYSLLKSTTAFSMKNTLDFLLASFGITDISRKQQGQLIKNLYKNNIEVKIEDGFFDFIDFCEDNSINYFIFSSAGLSIKGIPELVNRISNNCIYNLNGRSKVNPKTYQEAANELGLDLKKCLFIDDTPLALQIGKIQGMITVMMLNDVFTLEDYQIYSSFIDFKINSFTELGVIFNDVFFRK